MMPSAYSRCPDCGLPEDMHNDDGTCRTAPAPFPDDWTDDPDGLLTGYPQRPYRGGGEARDGEARDG